MSSSAGVAAGFGPSESSRSRRERLRREMALVPGREFMGVPAVAGKVFQQAEERAFFALRAKNFSAVTSDDFVRFMVDIYAFKNLVGEGATVPQWLLDLKPAKTGDRPSLAYQRYLEADGRTPATPFSTATAAAAAATATATAAVVTDSVAPGISPSAEKPKDASQREGGWVVPPKNERGAPLQQPKGAVETKTVGEKRAAFVEQVAKNTKEWEDLLAKDRSQQLKDLQAQGKSVADIQPQIQDSWRPTGLTDDGRRVYELVEAPVPRRSWADCLEEEEEEEKKKEEKKVEGKDEEAVEKIIPPLASMALEAIEEAENEDEEEEENERLETLLRQTIASLVDTLVLDAEGVYVTPLHQRMHMWNLTREDQAPPADGGPFEVLIRPIQMPHVADEAMAVIERHLARDVRLVVVPTEGQGEFCASLVVSLRDQGVNPDDLITVNAVHRAWDAVSWWACVHRDTGFRPEWTLLAVFNSIAWQQNDIYRSQRQL